MKKLLMALFCVALLVAVLPARGELAANVGDLLAANEFERLEGGLVRLPPNDGKIYVINLWATWCPPCRAEMPELQAFYDKYKDNPWIGLYLIDHAETPNAVRKFLQDNKLSLPILLDPEGKGVRMLYTNGIPTTVVIDKAGKIVFRKVGALTLAELERAVAQAQE